MKKMKNIETNTSKKPMKRLIALWVVFVMLIVPFANHVGKNDVKAEGESGTTTTGGTIAVSSPVDMTVKSLNLSLEMDTAVEGATPVNLASHTGEGYEKTYTFLKKAQAVAGIEKPTATGLTEGTAVNFEYKVYNDTDTVATEAADATAFPADNPVAAFTDKIIDSGKKIAIYAYVGNKTTNAGIKSILQYVIRCEFVESVFSSSDKMYDGGYVMATDPLSLPTTSKADGTKIMYATSTEETPNGATLQYSGNISLADKAGQTIKLFAATVIPKTEGVEGSKDTILEYKSLGTVKVTDDTTAPVITYWCLTEADTLKANHEGTQVTNSNHDNVNADNFFEDNVYYGNKSYYYFMITVKDAVGEGQTNATGLPDTDAVTAKCGDTELTVTKQGVGYYDIVIPVTVLKSGADNEISYTIKDKKGNANNGKFDIKLHQVTDHTTVESAKFLDDANSDLLNNATTINSTKTVQITIKSTKVVGKVALNDGTKDVFVSTNPTNGEMSAKREATVMADFTIPPEGTTDSTKYSSLKVDVYGIDDNIITQTDTKRLKDILFDKTPPTITSYELQEKIGSGSWNKVTLAADDTDTYTTKLDGNYRYVVTVTDDANGSGVDDTSVKAGENGTKKFEKNTLTSEYIYEITADDYASGSFSLTVQASDNAGNPAKSVTLPILKKLDTKFKVDGKWIYDSDKTTDITSQVTAETTKYSNHQLYLRLKLSSAYAIKKVELHAKDGVYTTLEGAQITNKQDNDTHRYTAEVEFALPKDTNVNELINKLYVTAEDSAPSTQTLTFPDTTPEGGQRYIGSILYDNTHPYATVSTIEDKWYQSYTLDYGIYSGNQQEESKLTKADYSFNNCAEPTTVSLVQPGSELPTYTGAVDVPESADPTGTFVQFAAEDMCLNNIEGTTEYRIKVDKQAPKIQFQVNGKNIFTNPIEGNVAIATAVSDNLTIAKATITVTKPDGSSVVKELCSNVIGSQTVSNNYTLDNLLGTKAADGAYTVTVNVADMSGRTASQTITFKVDNTIPVVTAKISDGVTAGKQPGKNFDGTDCDYFYRSNVTALLTYEDDNLAQSKVVVKDNGTTVPVQWSRVGTTNKYQATYVASKEGAHTITIGATDEAGNTAVTKQIVFIKDTAAPAITAVINGGMVYNENMGVVDLTANANVSFSVSDSNEDVKDFNYQLIKTEPDQLPVTADVIQTETRGFGYVDEADYIVKVYAIDKAGNKSAERTVQFRVDKTAPELKISGASSGATLNSGTTLTFSMTEAFWKDASGTVTITRKPKDGAQESTYKTIDFKPTARTTTMTETLSETGEYKVTFTGKDRAGHSAEAASYTVKIDTGKPVIALSGVKNNDKTTDAVEFTAQIDEDFYLTKSVSIKATRTYLDKTSYQEKTEDLQITGYNPAAATTLIRNTFTEDGIYKIQIDCKDAAGNTDTQEVSFTIDKTKPVIDAKVLAAYAGKLTAFSWDYDLDDIIYDLTVCDVHMYLNGTEYDGTSEVEDGAYELKIVAEDELGNQTEETSDFSLDTKAPTFIVTGVEDGEVKNEQYDINVSLQLEEDTLDSVSLNGKAIEIKDDAASITVTEKGDYKLTMKAHDEAGNEAEKTISFTYGEKKSVVLYVVIGVAALAVLGGGGAALIIGLRKKKA